MFNDLFGSPTYASPMTFSMVADPGMARALLSGRKTQLRVPAAGAIAQAMPGKRIWVREACIAARQAEGQEYATPLARADYVIFADGWRRSPDGSSWRGPRKADGDYEWVSALHMPRWASRATLLVEWRRGETLQRIGRKDVRAEGAVPLLGGLLWRWPPPIPGVDASARRAFARYWNLNHATPGERWEDDPEVVVLGVRLAEE